METAEAEVLQIEVVHSPAAGEMRQIRLSLPAGSRVADALRHSGLLPQGVDFGMSRLKVGVWGQLKPFDHPLRDHDRVEVYRPLLIDPKDARRRRHRTTCSRKR